MAQCAIGTPAIITLLYRCHLANWAQTRSGEICLVPWIECVCVFVCLFVCLFLCVLCNGESEHWPAIDPGIIYNEMDWDGLHNSCNGIDLSIIYNGMDLWISFCSVKPGNMLSTPLSLS